MAAESLPMNVWPENVIASHRRPVFTSEYSMVSAIMLDITGPREAWKSCVSMSITSSIGTFS